MRADTGRVLKRKRTTYQRLLGTGNGNADLPLFNETLVFDMPPQELIQTVLLVLVCLTDKTGVSPVGKSGEDNDSSAGASPVSSSSSCSSARNSTTVDEGLFHYSENLNFQKKGSNASSSSSGSSSANVGSNAQEERRGSQTLKHKPSRTRENAVGKVAFGFSVKNPIGKYHWEKMLRSPRNVTTEWHSLK